MDRPQHRRVGAGRGAIEGSAIVTKSRPRFIEPGLPALGVGVERYVVRGGGSATIRLEPGDRLELVNSEGGQTVELIAFADDGRDALSALGLRGEHGPSGLQAILEAGGEDAQRVRTGLARRGLDIGRVRAAHLFSPESLVEESIDLRAQGALTVIIAAPGRMTVWEQTPPTDILVYLTRRHAREGSSRPLPEPLAEPRLDVHINAASARSYEIAAGEYIQIIDVDGRQCSDFLAFSRRMLDRGRVRGLDSTTTRSLVGAAYPTPGLYSKLFSSDMEPLIEVIQDTVGRHDTFGLACNPRYYEDMGYFGHPNCSENFNNALRDFAIESERGWPAMNFFFNTWIDADNQYHLDEPYSRPGDYVLLRALSDLVCASSACPDDIDAANGWRTTDIHVRVYPKETIFKRAVAYRMTPDAPPRLTRETGFHPRTSALTSNFAEYRGFWLPTSFHNYGAQDEYWACRERAAVMDLSPLRKFEVMGPDAELLCQRTMTRNIRKVAIGQVAYTAMCYEHGGMIDDGTVFRLGPDNFRWIGGDDYGGIWLREKAKEWGLQVIVKTASDQIHNIGVQGPRSREILEKIVWTPPDRPTLKELQWFRFTVGRIGDFHGLPLVVSRTGYTGELGYEVFCHPGDAPAVWDAVFEAGAPFDIAPLGLDALDMLRIEAGLIFAGNDFDDQTDPFEAGIGFAVALKHEEDFVGRKALEHRRQYPQKRLVGLQLVGDEPAAHGDCVHIGRKQIGVVTSATRSPILAQNIALARLFTEYSALGTEVEVGKLDGHQKRLPATIVRFPFYDPDKSRVRA